MIGKKIKRIREQKGFSINELSEKAGVSKSYLSYIERGIQKNPSLQVLSKIAKTLDITVDYLLDKEVMNTSSNEVLIDEAWVSLVNDAIQNGITKEDFSYYLDFIKFKKDSDKV